MSCILDFAFFKDIFRVMLGEGGGVEFVNVKNRLGTTGDGCGRKGIFMLLLDVWMSRVVALLRRGVLCGRALNWPARWALN